MIPSGKLQIVTSSPAPPVASRSHRHPRAEPREHRRLAYTETFGSYLERYSAAVESAPSLDAVRAFGPPASYNPTMRLPVEQRKLYGDLEKPALANQIDVAKVLGKRVLEEKGVELPAVHAFFEGQLTRMGNGVKVRVEGTDEGFKTSKMIGVGLSTAPLHLGEAAEAAKAVGEQLAHAAEPAHAPEASVTVWTDPTGKEAAIEREAAAHGMFGSVEVDNELRLAVDGGVEVEIGDAAIKIGGHERVAPMEGTFEVAPVIGGKALGNDLTVRIGGKVQLVSPGLAKEFAGRPLALR